MTERIIIAGGGTGGHLFPGIAVLEEFRRRRPALEPIFVGTERGIESRVVPAMGAVLEKIPMGPLKGMRFETMSKSLSLLPGAFARSLALVRRYQPRLVLGVGGYAAGPVVLAAATLGRPTAILEQNASVGITNRLLAPFVGRVYVSFAETARHFAEERVRVCGNPLRRAFVHVAQEAMMDPEGFEARANTILILGGSQGARFLNETVPYALHGLALPKGMRIVHQSGSAMLQKVTETYAQLGMNAEVVPFLSDMAAAYASARVVIARSGATTLAEVCAIGRPSIFIPFPHATDDHQMTNVRDLSEQGGAIVMRENSQTLEKLREAVVGLIASSEKRRAMAEVMRRFGRPDAAASVVDDLVAWLGCESPPRVRPPHVPSGGFWQPSSKTLQGPDAFRSQWGHAI